MRAASTAGVSAEPGSPVGPDWDCVLSGKRNGIAYLTFSTNGNGTISGYEILVPQPLVTPRTSLVSDVLGDNGPGLPKAEHARIFERFYQSGALLSSKQPGSGLGLAITKAIVEGQGGRIFVDSEPGRGATFTLEFRPPPSTVPAVM